MTISPITIYMQRAIDLGPNERPDYEEIEVKTYVIDGFDQSYTEQAKAYVATFFKGLKYVGFAMSFDILNAQSTPDPF